MNSPLIVGYIFKTKDGFLEQKFSVPMVNSLILNLLLLTFQCVDSETVPCKSDYVLSRPFHEKLVSFILLSFYSCGLLPLSKGDDHSFLGVGDHDLVVVFSLKFLLFNIVEERFENTCFGEEL